MSTLADRIQEAFGPDAKPSVIARAAKISNGAVTQLLKGASKSLKGQTATNIELATGYRATWLLTGRGPKKVSQQTVFDELMPDEQELLENFRRLTDEDRAAKAEEIALLAAKTQAHVDKVLARYGVTPAETRAANARREALARAAVTIPKPNDRQPSLLPDARDEDRD